MIPLEVALRKLLSGVHAGDIEDVPVLKSLGRVLREDVVSPISIPPFDKASMDGYAVRAVDIKGASAQSPVSLKVLEDIPAGSVGKYRLGKGEAARIMTGAPVPSGADTVVMVEETEKSGDRVLIKKEFEKWDSVAPAGEDVKKGMRVIRAGKIIKAADMGMIAAVGMKNVKVAVKPRVAVISTGSEVVAPGGKLKAGQIFDANGYSIAGLAMARGADAKFLGIAKDRKGELEKKIKQAQDYDVAILSGGVSVGDYDLAPGVLADAGVKLIFHKVSIKPGMPTYAGKRGAGFVIALPGNPVSCMVCFELFVRPMLDKMLGKNSVGALRGRAILLDDARMKPNRRKFLRGVLQEIDGELGVRLASSQESGVLRGMVEADALIDVPEGVTLVPAGSEVDVVYME